ncbi:hypothetical protein Y032_0128g1461 [Ancylostoma ceylanicum]|uniref:Uncharacterized protein n=1 Tax=Ancylostoma ceylanicum TaxID=53326 RepID=A0A016T775_9BILA|nr:hypothetical protein Y032_0128g1461 [Ancylostoma ceylanicum]
MYCNQIELVQRRPCWRNTTGRTALELAFSGNAHVVTAELQAIRGKVDEFFERKWAGRVRVTRLKSLVFETGDGEGTKICISFLRKKPHPLRVNGKSRTSVVGIRDVIREISNLVNPSIRYVRPKTAVTR